MVNHPKFNRQKDSTAGDFDDVAMLRLPFGMVMLGKDQETDGRKFDGQVGIKYGKTSQDWLRMSYIDMKKIIDFCRENKETFNEQLTKELARNNMGVLE